MDYCEIWKIDKMSDLENSKKRVPWNKGKTLKGNPKYKAQYESVSKLNSKPSPFKGVKRGPLNLSEEGRRKKSEAQKGRKKSESEKLAISNANKGKKLSEETRQKMREVAQNRILSEKHKKSISKSKLSYWAEVKDARPYGGYQFCFGYHESPKAGSIRYRSSFELKFYQILDNNENVEFYEIEPIRVSYLYEGEQHTYFPDVRIFYTDGRIEIAEVKPKSRLNEPRNQAKFNAAMSTFGQTFKVYTEEDLNV